MAFRDEEQGGRFYRQPSRSQPPAVPSTPPMVAPPPPGAQPPQTGINYQYSYLPPQSFTDSPLLAGAKALGQKQLKDLLAWITASGSRALVNLGDIGLASNTPWLKLTPGTKGLVEQANTAGTSMLSQLKYGHDIAARTIPNKLAARGIVRSGETGYQLGEETRQYGLNQYQARQQTVDYLNNLYQNYLQQKFGIEQAVQNAYIQAYLAQISQPPTLSGISVSGLPPEGPGPGAAPSVATSSPASFSTTQMIAKRPVRNLGGSPFPIGGF